MSFGEKKRINTKIVNNVCLKLRWGKTIRLKLERRGWEWGFNASTLLIGILTMLTIIDVLFTDNKIKKKKKLQWRMKKQIKKLHS